MVSKNRRKQMLIHDVQFRLLTVNLAYFTTILFVFAMVLFAPLAYQLSRNDLSDATRQIVGDQFLLLDERIWPTLLIAFLCLAAHSIYVSHRIGGPLVQFRRAIKRLARGDLTAKIRLRQGDYLTTEADAFNELRDSLGVNLRDTQHQLGELCTELNTLKANVRDGVAHQVDASLAQLEDRTVVLQHTLSRFQTEERARGRGIPAGDRCGRRRGFREAVSGPGRQLAAPPTR